MVTLPIAALLSASVALAQAPAPQKRALTIDDLSRIHDIRDPQRSPDGAWVAYTVSNVDVEKDKRDTDIWMVRWDGSEKVRLTSSPENESSPRWSPDGKFLAFLASRGDDEEKKKGAQVWLLNRNGGEAEKLTDMPGGVAGFAWAPDSKRLVLACADADPDDNPEKKEGWNRKTKPPIVVTRHRFKEDRTGYLKTLYTHLYLFDLASRKPEQITSGPYDDEQPSWSPDGNRIAFVANRRGDADRDVNTDIYVVEAKAGATPKNVTTWEGRDGGTPAWSPDGNWIAYLQGEETRYFAYGLNKLAIVPGGGGEARVLTASLDRQVSSFRWTTDGKGLVFLVEDDRVAYIGRVAMGGGTVERLTNTRGVVSALSTAGPDGFAAIAGTDTQLNEVYAFNGTELKKLSDHNDEWSAGIQMATTEDVTFKAKDGTIVNGLLVKPASYRAGTLYPALLYIHGGPNGQDDHSFDFDREFLAANGYVVLQVNYRGSAGRGAAYQKAIYADWGHLEVVDLLAGADFLVNERIADPNRLGIGGWSYGGILTNYTIATDPRFKAAVSGASSSLQTTMYGLDQYIVQYEAEMGQPWKTKDLWDKVSYPFYHVDRIKTPTLFLCGEKDFNVPIAGVEQMYQALRSIGVPTELVIYPGQFHGLTVPSYQRDRLTRFVAWYDKHLKAAPQTAGQ